MVNREHSLHLLVNCEKNFHSVLSYLMKHFHLSLRHVGKSHPPRFTYGTFEAQISKSARLMGLTCATVDGWFRNPVNSPVDMVVYPIIYMVLAPFQVVVWDFQHISAINSIIERQGIFSRQMCFFSMVLE